MADENIWKASKFIARVMYRNHVGVVAFFFLFQSTFDGAVLRNVKQCNK